MKDLRAQLDNATISNNVTLQNQDHLVSPPIFYKHSTLTIVRLPYKAQASDIQAEEIGVLAIGGRDQQADGTYGISRRSLCSFSRLLTGLYRQWGVLQDQASHECS